MAREGKMGWNSQKFKENKNKKWVFCVIFILSKVKSNPIEIKSDFFFINNFPENWTKLR